MHSEERAFLTAICEHPAEDAARLVFADWLADYGQPERGEFIRVEVELARTPPTTEGDERRRRLLLDRRAELLKEHKREWLAPFSPYAKESSFVRGFVQSLDVPANTFVQNAGKWLSLTPLTHVKFTSFRVWERATASYMWWAAELFSSPHLSRLEVIDLESLRLEAVDLETLAAHPDLSRLRELVLAWNGVRSDGARLLAAMPQLRNLTSLDLRGNGITDSGARAVAESEYLGNLTELRMTRNSIRDRAWRMLEDRFGDALVG